MTPSRLTGRRHRQHHPAVRSKTTHLSITGRRVARTVARYLPGSATLALPSESGLRAEMTEIELSGVTRINSGQGVVSPPKLTAGAGLKLAAEG